MSSSILAAHTAGPWQWVDPDTDEPWDGGYARFGSLRTVATFGVNETKIIEGKSYTTWALPKFIIDSESIGGDGEAEANARLMEAAPDLLAALQCMLEQFTKTPSTLKDSEARAKAHAAIQKATGVRP